MSYICVSYIGQNILKKYDGEVEGTTEPVMQGKVGELLQVEGEDLDVEGLRITAKVMRRRLAVGEGKTLRRRSAP